MWRRRDQSGSRRAAAERNAVLGYASESSWWTRTRAGSYGERAAILLRYLECALELGRTSRSLRRTRREFGGVAAQHPVFRVTLLKGLRPP